MDAVINYHKLDSLKPRKFILSQSWRADVNMFPWTESVSQGCTSSGGSGKPAPCLLPFPASWGLGPHHSSFCLHLHITISDVHMSNIPLLLFSKAACDETQGLCRSSRMIFPSQYPKLNHICKGPFSKQGNLYRFHGLGGGQIFGTTIHPTTQE